SSIADLERQLAQLSAAREEAAIRAGLANEAYLEATVHLDAARAESRQARRVADAAAAEAEVARGALATIAQLLYQGGSASLASITPFLTDDFASAMRTATHMDQLARRTDAQLQHFEALRTVSAILTERAERAQAAEQAAVDSLAAAAEAALELADAAAFQLAVSTEQRDALIEQLARQRETTVELERARQDALEEQRIERENRAALREAQAVAAIDSLAAAPAVAPVPELVDDRDTAVSRDGDRDTSSPATTAPTATSVPSPSTPSPTTPAPAPPPPAPAPLAASQIALDFALAQVGKPYVWGADGPDSYDCSGLTMASYLAAGIYIGRTTRTQYYETARVPLADMRPGDLVFYSSDGTAAGIYHVAMYTGNNMRVHAPSPGKLVEHVKMYYYNVMPYAGRVTG
ncbi:MAG: C40 family peptidase, partial [Actinomycetes bacterium]|nr:C40 family peptidase [Actinomycetes bacterium]MDX5451073.1 C40 family peptidase [Actinomycetes bacterium]